MAKSENEVPMVENIESSPCKKIKLDLNRVLDLPNEIWMKITKYLPAKDVYGTLTLVNKRFQSLALESGVLRIIKINPLNNKKEMNILEHFTGPVKLICEESYIRFASIKAIFLTKNLKSLEFCNDQWENHKFNGMDYHLGEELDMDFICALKQSNAKLEHLELKGFCARAEVMIEITKMKTLKTFKISDARKVVITPEVVHAFAQNEYQLENIEFDDFNDHDFDLDYNYQFSDALNEALNNLLNKKSNTLKSLKRITWDGISMYSSKVPLTNLKLCQNLEEFCGRLRPRDIKILAKLPRLQKLKLSHLKNPKYLLNHLNLDSLKYLSLSGPYNGEAKNIICQELPKHHFPILQRLFIGNSPKLTEKFFSKLILNAPKLKSIQLNHSECPVSYQFMHNFFKNSNIFVCFNSKSFEEFLIGNDPIVFQKYNQMKNYFCEWSSTNKEYAS